MVLGMAIAVLVPSAVIAYAIIFLYGLFAGRLIYERTHRFMFPYLVIISGFVIGFMIGMYHGSSIVAIILFLCATVLSYKLHKEKIIKNILF